MSRRRVGAAWLKWAIMWMFLIVSTPICAAYVLAETDWGRQRIRDMVVEAMEQELGLSARLRELDVDVETVPPTLVVTARGIALDDPEYGRFADAETLVLRPSLASLLRGELDLRSIELDQPSIRLVVREGEIRNLPRIRADAEPAGDVELPFRRLVARSAQIEVDAEPFATAGLQEVDLEVRVRDGRRVHVRAESSSGQLRHARGVERLQKLLLDGEAALDEGVAVRRFVLRTPHVRFELADGQAPLPLQDRWQGRVDLKLDLDHISRLPVAWGLPPLAGHLAAEGRLEHTPDGARGSASVRLENVHVEERWGLGERITARVQFDPKAVRFEQLRAELVKGGGAIELEGSIGLGEGLPVDVRGQLEAFQFDRLMDQLGISSDAIVSWHIDGGVSLRGTLDPLDLKAPMQLETRDFLVSTDAWHRKPRDRVLGVSRARLTTRMVIRSGSIRFADIVADTPASQVRADVFLGFDDELGITATLDPLDLADVTPLAGFQIGGRGRARVEVSGVYSDPALTAHLDVDDFSFDEIRIGRVESDARLEKGALAVRFPAVSVVKNDSRYLVRDLLLDWTRDRFEATGTVEANRLTLADVYHTFRYDGDERFAPYQGVAQGEVDIRYTLGFPGDSPTGTMLLDLDLELPEVEIQGFAFTDGRFAGRWHWLRYEQGYRGAELDIEHLELHKGDGAFSVSGRMGLGGELQMTASADELLIQQTEGLREALPDLRGSYGVLANVRGTADVPRVHLDLSLTGITWQGELLGDGRAYVRMTDVEDPWVTAARDWDRASPPANEPCAHARAGLAQADWPADRPLRTADGPEPALSRPMAYLVCGKGLGGRVEVDLAMGRTSVYPLRGLLKASDLDLTPFLPDDQLDGEVHGSLSGQVLFLGGAMKTPETLVASLDVSSLRMGTEQVELRNDGALELEADRGIVRVERAHFMGPSSSFAVRGEASLDHGLALQLEGNLELGLLATLSARVREARGLVSMRMNVTGPMEDPAVYGEAAVRQAEFLFASFTQPVQDLNGNVTFSARRVLFEDFRAQVAGGRIAMEGAATLRGRALERYHFDVVGRDLALFPEDGIEVGVGGRVRLSWETEQRLPSLVGTLRLDRVLYTRPMDLSPTLGQLYQPQRRDVERYDPDADLIELDVRLVDEGPLRVENNLVQSEIEIEDSEREFRVVGTDQRFGILGTLVVPRGTVYFRNTEFVIRRGVIEFDDRYRIDPHFDVRAETTIRRAGELAGPDWRITLQAHGNSDAFRLDASSEPELSQQDLMLLLAVGMTRTEAEQLQAGELGGAAALEALSAVTGVDREVQRRLPGIDEFSLSSRYSTQTNRTEPWVSVGKRIADRVRMSAASALSAESRELRTGIEWELSDQTSVQTVYDNVNTEGTSSFGNIGVDLRWRLEFE